jgi:hypothetical protein
VDGVPGSRTGCRIAMAIWPPLLGRALAEQRHATARSPAATFSTASVGRPDRRPRCSAPAAVRPSGSGHLECGGGATGDGGCWWDEYSRRARSRTPWPEPLALGAAGPRERSTRTWATAGAKRAPRPEVTPRANMLSRRTAVRRRGKTVALAPGAYRRLDESRTSPVRPKRHSLDMALRVRRLQAAPKAGWRRPPTGRACPDCDTCLGHALMS